MWHFTSRSIGRLAIRVALLSRSLKSVSDHNRFKIDYEQSTAPQKED
jgi:hypothetical protein